MIDHHCNNIRFSFSNRKKNLFNLIYNHRNSVHIEITIANPINILLRFRTKIFDFQTMAVRFMVVLTLSKFCCYVLAALDASNHILVNPNTAQSADDGEVDSISITPISQASAHSITLTQPIRYRRSAHNHDKSFIRFGRNSDSYDRKSDKNLVRFGRNESPAKSNGFIRFGRSNKSFMRFGRDDNSDAVRFGRRGDKFIRFGRSGSAANTKDRAVAIEDLLRSASERTPENSLDALDGSIFKPVQPTLTRLGRNGNNNFIRFGRRDSGIRLGKKNAKLDVFDAADSKSNMDNDLDDSQSSESGSLFDMNDDGATLQASSGLYSGKVMQPTINDEQQNENRDKFLSMLDADYL